MIYKKHELSLSLNGDQVMHIARNAAGVVVFREQSEKALKLAIDDYIKKQQYLEEMLEQKRLEKEAKKSQGDSAKAHPTGSHEVAEPTSSGDEVVEESLEAVEPTSSEEVLVPQKRVTRGPDGKFISKSQLDQEEIKKKTFWDKLTS